MTELILRGKAITRRALLNVLQRAWVLLFMIPFRAMAQCCDNVYIDCTWGGEQNCDGTAGFFAADDFDDPAVYFAFVASCIDCVIGCSCCTYVQVTAVGYCCGDIEYYHGYMCCTDPDCCDGCG